MPEQKISDVVINELVYSLVAEGKGHPIDLTINNYAGQPFEVITEPGGRVAWGVGGSKVAFENPGDPAIAKAVRSAIANAAEKPIHVTVQTQLGKPFEVITEPGGRLAWGVGGSKAQ